MSTKIYEAYRIKVDCDPWDTLWSIQASARALVRARLREIFAEVIDGRTERERERHDEIGSRFYAWRCEHHPGDHPPYKIMELLAQWTKTHDYPRESLAKTRVTRAQILADLKEADDAVMFPLHLDRWFFEKFAKQVHLHTRNEWDLSSCIAVRVHEQRFYLIPYCERISLTGNVLESMASDPRLEDFCYFDNTDPPKDARHEWPHRGAIWNYFLDRWDQHLVLDILSVSNWYQVVTFEMLRSGTDEPSHG